MINYQTIVLYKKSQTFVNTIYDYLYALKKNNINSDIKFKYLDIDSIKNTDILRNFDCIIVHYSIRICYFQIPEFIEKFLKSYFGTKVLFIQDEYDNTNITKRKINELKFDLVFTCVPKKKISLIYPKEEFPFTKFENVLTSYCLDQTIKKFYNLKKSRERKIIVGYRGRELPLRYGELGQQKKEIALAFRYFCKKNNIKYDIKYKESDRIYGKNWIKFLCNSRFSLGTESGCNIFDFDGKLDSEIKEFQSTFKENSSQELKLFLNSKEIKNCMNQISSRIFEAINSRSALLLIEGNYSNILIPYRHYIPIKKDFSNIKEVSYLFANHDFIDELTERTYKEISLSKRYSYDYFQIKVSKMIVNEIKSKVFYKKEIILKDSDLNKITEKPLRPIIFQNSLNFKFIKFLQKIITLILYSLPKREKRFIKTITLNILRKFNIL